MDLDDLKHIIGREMEDHGGKVGWFVHGLYMYIDSACSCKEDVYERVCPRGLGRTAQERAQDFVNKIAGKVVFWPNDDNNFTGLRIPVTLKAECWYLQELKKISAPK